MINTDQNNKGNEMTVTATFTGQWDEAVFADMPSKALPEWTTMRFNSNSESGRYIAHSIEALRDLVAGEVDDEDKPETMDYIVLALQNAYSYATEFEFHIMASTRNEEVARAALTWFGAPLDPFAEAA